MEILESTRKKWEATDINIEKIDWQLEKKTFSRTIRLFCTKRSRCQILIILIIKPNEVLYKKYIDIMHIHEICNISFIKRSINKYMFIGPGCLGLTTELYINWATSQITRAYEHDWANGDAHISEICPQTTGYIYSEQ